METTLPSWNRRHVADSLLLKSAVFCGAWTSEKETEALVASLSQTARQPVQLGFELLRTCTKKTNRRAISSPTLPRWILHRLLAYNLSRERGFLISFPGSKMVSAWDPKSSMVLKDSVSEGRQSLILWPGPRMRVRERRLGKFENKDNYDYEAKSISLRVWRGVKSRCASRLQVATSRPSAAPAAQAMFCPMALFVTRRSQPPLERVVRTPSPWRRTQCSLLGQALGLAVRVSCAMQLDMA